MTRYSITPSARNKIDVGSVTPSGDSTDTDIASGMPKSLAPTEALVFNQSGVALPTETTLKWATHDGFI